MGIGTVVVVAKVPRAAGGRSKTRLIPLLGEEGATALARAMLLDVLSTVQQVDECHKVVLYAPPTGEARGELRDLLDQLASSSDGRGTDRRPSSHDDDDDNNNNKDTDERRHAWTLMEMRHATLQDSNLSKALTAASRAIASKGGLFPDTSAIVFVGMDAPELGKEQVHEALRLADGEALLCPAQDGGYGLLGVSLSGTENNDDDDDDDDCSRRRLDALFEGVLWSHPLTALSQIRAAQRAGFGTLKVGHVLRDVDVPGDVKSLCQRLAPALSPRDAPPPPTSTDAAADAAIAAPATTTEPDLGCLEGPSGTTGEVGERCPHTRQALQLLGLLP